MEQNFNYEKKQAFLQYIMHDETGTVRSKEVYPKIYQEFILPAEQVVGCDVADIQTYEEYWEFYKHCRFTPSRIHRITLWMREYLDWCAKQGYMNRGQVAFHPASRKVSMVSFIKNVGVNNVLYPKDNRHTRAIVDAVLKNDYSNSSDNKVKAIVYLAAMGFSQKEIAAIKKSEVDNPPGFILGKEIPDEFYDSMIYFKEMKHLVRPGVYGRDTVMYLPPCDNYIHNDRGVGIEARGSGRIIIKFNARVNERYHEFPDKTWDLSIDSLRKLPDLNLFRRFHKRNPTIPVPLLATQLSDKGITDFKKSAAYEHYYVWLSLYYPNEFERLPEFTI